MRHSIGFGVLSRAAKAVEERGHGVRRAEQHLLVIGDVSLYLMFRVLNNDGSYRDDAAAQNKGDVVQERLAALLPFGTTA